MSKYTVHRRYTQGPVKNEFGSLVSAKRFLYRKVSRTGREHYIADEHGFPIYAARRIRGRLVTENLLNGHFGTAAMR